MKFKFLVFGLLARSWVASADCYTPTVARDAIRAIALISDRSSITDLVGGSIESDGTLSLYRIWANYRNQGFSDEYEVTVEEKSCRITSLKLVAPNLPIKNGDISTFSNL